MDVDRPWFYFSFAQADDCDFIKEFYNHLNRAVANLTALESSDSYVGFLDSELMLALGDQSREEPLATSRTLVCLYSPEYFKSEYCGKAFQVFLDRVKEVAASAQEADPPQFIFPVLWAAPDQLPQPLPGEAANIEYLSSEFGEPYATGGLYSIMDARTSENEPQYQELVSKLGERIVRAAQLFPLPPMQDVPELNSIPSAFHKSPVSKAGLEDEFEGLSKVEDVLREFSLSGTALKTMERAISLEDGLLITTSTLLFALESGAVYLGLEGAPHFVATQLAGVPKVLYGRVTRAYFDQARQWSDQHLNGLGPDSSSEPGRRVSQHALEVLNKAKEFSERTPKDGRIHARHILAALLLLKPSDDEIGAHLLLKELNLEIPKLREQFFEVLTKQSYVGEGEGQDDLRIWREILVPKPLDLKSRLPSFDADVDSEDDLLGIDNDVNAFAALIAAHSVKPPLSIGLFGDWGSGKSFFMRRVRKRVSALSREARNSPLPQRDVAFYRGIAQIEFNAWHYSESNLWASLVEYIFQNLKISDDDDADVLKKREEALLKDMKVEERAQGQAEANEKEALEKLEAKQRDLRLIEEAHEEKTKALASLAATDVSSSILLSVGLSDNVRTEALSVLDSAGITGVGTAAKDVQSALAEARRVFERGSSLLTPLLKAEDGGKRFRWLIVILVAAPLAGLGVGYVASAFNAELRNITAYLTGLATLTSAGAAWVRKQAAWMSESLRKAEGVKQEVDKQIDEQMASLRSQHAQDIAQHRQELELIKAKYSALRGEREEAQQRVDEIRTALRQNTAAGLLANFIQDRAASDDYRKYLGLLALIRRDFQTLSGNIALSNKKLLEMDKREKEENDVVAINRIVLYIDDLDRCTPRQVATVLQAVHLLLAFPLFVVVVGVDVRWVARALRKQYPNLLGNPTQPQAADIANAEDEHRATPHDYLEKIFQIPFWLNPLEATTTMTMVKGLMPITKILEQQPVVREEHQEESDKAKTSKLVSGKKGREDKKGQTEEENGAGGGDVEADKEGKGEMQKAGTVREKAGGGTQMIALPALDMKPDALDILSIEVTFVEELTPLLGRSPRSVKRFINTYRLIKAGLSPAARATFFDETSDVGQFRIVLFLLSIVTGLPSISREFFQRVMDADAENNKEQGLAGKAKKKTFHGLGSVLPGSDADPGKSDVPEWSPLVNWLEKYEMANAEKGQSNNFGIEDLADWIPRVARYSFNIRGL